MAMTIRTIEDRFARLLALHDMVLDIEENNQGELEFLANNPTMNAFITGCKEHMEQESDLLAQEIALHALEGEFPQFQGLLDNIVKMALENTNV